MFQFGNFSFPICKRENAIEYSPTGKSYSDYSIDSRLWLKIDCEDEGPIKCEDGDFCGIWKCENIGNKGYG